MAATSSSAKPNVTLRDIARKVGTSHVTVSLALRENPRIPPAHRKQIQEVARKMGYRPNATAAALAHFKFHSKQKVVQAALAWINLWPDAQKLRECREPARYWSGAQAAAEKLGYRLEEFVSNEQMPLARLQEVLLARGINGILIPPHPVTPVWDGFHWEHFSVVRIGRSIQIPRTQLVAADEVANALLAVRSMRERGYARIGFVNRPRHGEPSAGNDCFYGEVRMIRESAGFIAAQADLPRSEQLAPLTLPDEMREREAALRKWLEKEKPDAVLTNFADTRDLMMAAGFRVPNDLGFASLRVLSLGADAGVYPNFEEIGRVAILVLVSLVGDHARGLPEIGRQILIEGEWVDGSSLPERRSHTNLSAPSKSRHAARSHPARTDFISPAP